MMYVSFSIFPRTSRGRIATSVFPRTSPLTLPYDYRFSLSLFPSVSYAGLPSSTSTVSFYSRYYHSGSYLFSGSPLRQKIISPVSSDGISFSNHYYSPYRSPSYNHTLSVRWMTASPKKKARRLALKSGTLLPENMVKQGRIARNTVVKKQFQKFSVALIGRPNVGKSSLFNRLAHKRLAIVNAIPGTTRDWKEAEGQLGEMSFIIMDTGGLEDQGSKDSIERKMLGHTEQAIKLADVVLFIIDARQGVTHDDERFARWLKQRRPQGHIHLVANKTEGWLGTAVGDDRWEEIVKDCYRLGFGEPVPISAEHGEGLLGIYQTLEPYGLITSEPSVTVTKALTETEEESSDKKEETDPLLVETRGRQRKRKILSRIRDTDDTVNEEYHGLVPIASPTSTTAIHDPSSSLSSSFSLSLPIDPQSAKKVQARLRRIENPIQLTIVGRPNVGKSTLVNQLLGEQRVLAGPTPGLTRDAVKVELQEPITGRKIQLVDTAGMRRWGTWDLSTPLEGLAVGLAKQALALSNVVALVIDGSGGHPYGLTNDPIQFSSSILSIRTPTISVTGLSSSTESFSSRSVSTAVRAQRKVSSSSSDVVEEAVIHRQPPEDTGKAFGMTVQDLAIAHQIMEEGRGLVLILNKMDACPNPEGFKEVIRQQMARTPHGKGIEMITVSALRGLGMEQLLPAVLRVYDRWNRRISTARLNIWLQLVTRHHPPPTVRRVIGMKGTGSNREYNSVPVAIRLKYITQINSRPPTFNLYVNRSDIPESYTRYIVNNIREEFDLKGIPLRFHIRTSLNPFSKLGRKQKMVKYKTFTDNGTSKDQLERSNDDHRNVGDKYSSMNNSSDNKYQGRNGQREGGDTFTASVGVSDPNNKQAAIKIPLSQEIQRRMRSLVGSGGTMKPFSRKDKRVLKEMKLTPKRRSRFHSQRD